MSSPSSSTHQPQHISSPDGPPAQLSTSPYKSTFSSFFQSITTSDAPLDQQVDAGAEGSSVPTVQTSTEALDHLECCLDGLKRQPPPTASPSTATATTTATTLTPIQTNLSMDAQDELAHACGWIFTGLVLEIVSLASESCRAARGADAGDLRDTGDQQDPVTGEEAGEHSAMEARRDKGKHREDQPVCEKTTQRAGRRRRRFSLSFGFKGILNLDDIDERLDERPDAGRDQAGLAVNWDTLCELLKHLVEIHHHEDFPRLEHVYQYPIPLDLVWAHNPLLTGPIQAITPRHAPTSPHSAPCSPVDRVSCPGADADCPEPHTHLSTGRRALTILCGRLKTLIEQRDEIQLHGHKSAYELDALEGEEKERVIWVKACLACCLYLLARWESPSQLYLLQLQELLPTGISHIDYLVNDIAASFLPKSDKGKTQRQAGGAGRPGAPSTDGTLAAGGVSPKSQRTTLRGHRRTLSAKPSSIFSLSSSVFSVGGRLNRPVKSATSLPQLSFEAASFSGGRWDSEIGSSLPNPPPSLRRSEGSGDSAASILHKYRPSNDGAEERERRSPWGRFASLRPFQRSPLTSTTSLPASAHYVNPPGRSDSSQSITSDQSSSRPRNIRSIPIKEDSPPRLSDSVTSEETNESQGLEIPAIKTIACTPSPRTAGMFPKTPPSKWAGHLGPRIRGGPRAFENHMALAPLDPALAAAEKASVLTKKNHCVVCGKEGYNFPACRRCNQTFCSRECRVGFNKGGDGKKHVCGMTKHRPQFLEVPVASPAVKTERQTGRLSVS